MIPDDRLDEVMGRALREVDPPPPTPREEIWARIQTARATQKDAEHTAQKEHVVELKPRIRHSTWVPWSAAIAATLALGIGLGRMSTPDTSAPADTPTASAQSDAVPAAYRVAAANHLQRTETLLASLVVDSRPGGPSEMSSWAHELLTDTRLLLSSPAAEDAATRRLLEDLELVLAQIAGIPEARAEEEVELIQNGINESDVLLRLRAATAGPALVGT